MNDRQPQDTQATRLIRLIRDHDAELREAIPDYQYAAVYPIRVGLNPAGGRGVVVHVCGSYDLTSIANHVHRILGQDLSVSVRRERRPLAL